MNSKLKKKELSVNYLKISQYYHYFNFYNHFITLHHIDNLIIPGPEARLSKLDAGSSLADE